MASETYQEPAGRTIPRGELDREPTGWVGWIYFASVMMMLSGTLNALHGVIAIVNDEWVVWGNQANLYIDLTTWGWVHLGIGIAVFLAGLGVLTGNIVARIVGVLFASVAIIANFLYIPAYPVWALTIITMSVFVIYALTAHGRELR